MKKHLIWILALTFILNINSVRAAELAGKWSVSVSGGMGITLGPEEFSDYFPTSFALSGDLTYMLSENIGLVPFAFNYLRLSFDDEKFGQDYGFPSAVMDEIDTSVWAFGYTPGLLFTSSGDSKVRGFGQVGLGLYHSKNTVEAEIIDMKEEESENDFGMLFGGGIEADISERAAIVGKVRFHWVATEDESTTSLDFSGGIKLFFGR